ncbi:hypothetical protein Taro_041011 [Colocasia esculenta]|uniref:TOG domain-containing protein n=1 Tax=Colocasia esculenta TaxID=4460 RepID=A0A843WKF5_COLES|nr:hypothetical protein [Colocasia esculenta]
MKYLREDLQRRLLSTDFKKQVDGVEILQRALHSCVKEIIELLDVLLRWFVLRFCESNTTCLLKSGHNIERVREKMRELMKQIVHVYSASKLFPYILEGLRSKNNRTRIECVDLLGFLIDHYGAEISVQFRSLQLVAGLTSERDGEIRKAALNTLATAYKILGEDIWRFVGKLSDAQKSMLDDRFKWKAREMDKRREGKPGDARASFRRSVRDNGLDMAEQSGEVVSRSLMAPTLTSGRDVYGERDVDQHIFSRSIAAANGPLDWREALGIISLGSPEQRLEEGKWLGSKGSGKGQGTVALALCTLHSSTATQSVEGMKVVCHELTQVTMDPENSVLEDLVKEADRLVSCLANMVPKTFGFSLAGASSRSCKYVLNTLMQTFQIKRLAHAVRESTLDNLITELLLWLLDERVPLMDDGSQLLKALNVLMLKILDNAERTSSFVVLINLLRPLDPSRWPSPMPSETVMARNQKFSELVVKCLIKLTKVLQSTIFDVDLDRILQSIHVYLQELGMEEIRRRAGADDKPLRMVKTVLHELVKLRGTAIKGHLSMVPIDTEPQPIILAYIDLNLQTLAAARMLTPSVPMGQTHWADSATNSPAPTAHSADAQLKQELAAVFKKIGDKQTCSIGLYELYRITQLYPKVDIFAQLQNASEAFRTYIRDGLAQVTSDVPFFFLLFLAYAVANAVHEMFCLLNTDGKKCSCGKDSLKPSYLNSTSPSFKYLIPKDTVGTMLPTRVAGDMSEFKPQLGEDRNDRIMPAATAVTPGTLDAIRERMRSIQAAAAAENMEGINRPMIYMNGNMNHGLPVQNQMAPSDVERPVHSNVLPMDEKALSGLQARMERLKSGGLEPL